tara:strand:+ start:3951 stop:4124 length:174 start_codon:yes stop_codon:yes gene_type:complete
MSDPYVMGLRPQVKLQILSTIVKVKAIEDVSNDSNVKYLCEEIISDLEDLKLEIDKL